MHHQNPHLQNDYPIFDYSAVQQFSRVFKACYSDIKVRRETVSFYDYILPQLQRVTSVVCHLLRVTFSGVGQCRSDNPCYRTLV